jgi:hypothetical protein
VTQVPDELLARLVGVDEHQYEVGIVGAQEAQYAAQQAAEERVGEHAAQERLAERVLFGLGDGQRDQAGAPGDQGPGRAVRYVAGRRDRLLHDAPQLRVDVPGLVYHPGNRCPGDAGHLGHVLQRERWPRGRRPRGRDVLGGHGACIARTWESALPGSCFATRGYG